MQARMVMALLVLAGCSMGPSVESAEASSSGETGELPGDSSTSDAGGTESSGDESSDDEGSSGDGSSDDEGSSGDEPPVDPPVVVYLNFDGVELMATGRTDSRTNEWPGGAEAKTYPPETDENYRDRFHANLASYFRPFNVAFTRQRPESGEYVMVVVSPVSNNNYNTVTLVASVDCGNAWPNDIVIADSREDAAYTSLITASAVGKVFGLDHVDDPADVMYGQRYDDRAFMDACVPLLDSPSCPISHNQFCEAGTQNSFAELMDRLGPAVSPD